MPGKTFEPSRRGIRQLNEYLTRNGKGTTVYTVVTLMNWGLGEERVYNTHVFDRRAALTGNWMSSTNSVADLMSREGAVYTEPPRGVRNSADPAPQVAGPLGHGEYRGYLDEAELRGLEKHVKGGSDPYTRELTGGAAKPRRRHSW